MKHKYITSFALLLGLLLTALQLQAQIFLPNVVYKLTNQVGGGVLEIGGGGTVPNNNGSPANMWPYYGNANQEWYLQNLGTTDAGPYKIISRNSNQCLEIGGSSSKQLQWGARANQWPYFGNANQQWTINFINNNGTAIYTVEFVNVRSGQLLSTDENVPSNGGAPVYQATRRSNSISQRWAVTVAGPQPATEGVYSIINKRSNRALEVGGASLDQGASINQWPYFGNSNQQWTITNVGQGFYSIRNRNSGQALEVGGGDAANYEQGRATNQWPYYGGQNQQWAIDWATGAITNRKSGQVLEIGGSDATQYADGSLANQWPDYGNDNQRWTLTFVSQYRTGTVLATTASTATNKALSLYPNPATSTLSFSLATNAKATSVTITDMRGTVVKNARVRANNQVDVADVAAGIYLLTVTDGQQTYRQKFVKQ